MKNTATKIITFSQKDAGVTAIEYALIASLIALVIVVSIGAVGDKVVALYQSVATQLP